MPMRCRAELDVRSRKDGAGRTGPRLLFLPRSRLSFPGGSQQLDDPVAHQVADHRRRRGRRGTCPSRSGRCPRPVKKLRAAPTREVGQHRQDERGPDRPAARCSKRSGATGNERAERGRDAGDPGLPHRRAASPRRSRAPPAPAPPARAPDRCMICGGERRRPAARACPWPGRAGSAPPARAPASAGSPPSPSRSRARTPRARSWRRGSPTSPSRARRPPSRRVRPPRTACSADGQVALRADHARHQAEVRGQPVVESVDHVPEEPAGPGLVPRLPGAPAQPSQRVGVLLRLPGQA